MSLDPIALALLLTFTFTLLVTAIEITAQSPATLRATCNGKYWLYFFIQLVGNVVATILVSVMLEGVLPANIKHLSPVIFAFAGVFAFEIVLANTNINIFDKKVLTFQEWVYKAKAPAIARATEKHLQSTEHDKMQLATKLKHSCSLQTIDTHLLPSLNSDERKRMKKDIQSCGADEHLYKCIELVSRDYNKSKALLKNQKKLPK